MLNKLSSHRNILNLFTQISLDTPGQTRFSIYWCGFIVLYVIFWGPFHQHQHQYTSTQIWPILLRYLPNFLQICVVQDRDFSFPAYKFVASNQPNLKTRFSPRSSLLVHSKDRKRHRWYLWHLQNYSHLECM